MTHLVQILAISLLCLSSSLCLILGLLTLAEHLRTASTHHNALYTSKTTQNEIIDICGSATILADIHDANFLWWMKPLNSLLSDVMLTLTVDV